MGFTSKPEIAEGAENVLTQKIIAAAIEVHRHLGPGLMESAYEMCLCYELSRANLRFDRQVHLPVSYKDIKLDCAYRLDLAVEDCVIVEIKAIDDLLPIHTAQLLTYLRASGKQVGLLLNFNVPILKHGLKRVVNRYVESREESRSSAPSANEMREERAAAAGSAGPNPNSPLRNSPFLSVSAVNQKPATKKEPH